MNSERLKQLFDFLEHDPEDSFTIYAIALEYLQENQEKAKEYLDILLEKHPDYLPTYYQAALLYQSMNEDKKAINIFEKGIELAQKTNSLMTKRELQNALNELLFEEDD
ncbi:MAG: tetratricopeptide repeat protein [Cytophagales bacterium]|nr:tetratricopeptide repeat protein [Cytophagales bacterium]